MYVDNDSVAGVPVTETTKTISLPSRPNPLLLKGEMLSDVLFHIHFIDIFPN